jgi:hypothetical protein
LHEFHNFKNRKKTEKKKKEELEQVYKQARSTDRRKETEGKEPRKGNGKAIRHCQNTRATTTSHVDKGKASKDC